MDTVPAEEDAVGQTESDDDDEEEEQRPTPRRRKPASGLIPLVGKPKTPKSNTKSSRAVGKQPSKRATEKVTMVPGSDEEATPKPVRRKAPPRRKTLDGMEIVDVSEGLETLKTPLPRKKAQKKQLEKIIPDSAGEERDVWVISSDNE
jgi:hypothetical protein